MDGYTQRRIRDEQALQQAAQERADQERRNALARLAMEEGSKRVREAMEEAARAKRQLEESRNRETGYMANWR